MNDVLAKFVESGYSKVDDFVSVLASLTNSKQQSDHIIFNQAILQFHSGHFKEACENFKRLLSSGVFNCNECIQIVLALAEIYLLLAQPSKALDMTSLMAETFKPDPNDKYGVVALARLKNATLRARIVLKKIEVVDFDCSNIVPDAEALWRWTECFLKAQSEYRNGNMKLVGQLLAHADAFLNNESGVVYGQPTDFYRHFGYCRLALKSNAYACMFDRLAKPNLALLHVHEACKQYEASRAAVNNNNLQPAPFYCRSSLHRLKLMHNEGVALLKVGQPLLAFNRLLQVVSTVNNNPRLWLRLAECCIAVHHKKLAAYNAEHDNKSLVQEIIGVGPHRKIVIRNFSTPLNVSSDTSALPGLTLEFASSCLKNALGVLPDVDVSSLDSDEPFHLIPLSNPVPAKEILRIRSSVLCAYAYVCLCMGEMQAALQSAKNLLNLKSIITTEHKILAHLYASEACLLLDKIPEALSYLKIDLPSPTPKPSADQLPQPTTIPAPPSDVDLKSFKIVVYYNTAVVYALHKEYDKASQILTLIMETVKDVPVHFPILQLYIMLQKGQIEEARQTVLKTLRIPLATRG